MKRTKYILVILVFILTFTFCASISQAEEIAPPLNLKVKQVTHDSVTLNWSVGTGADGYSIYRSDFKSNRFTKIATISNPNVTTFIDREIYTSGKTYYYRIASYFTNGNSGGEVGENRSVSATPRAGEPLNMYVSKYEASLMFNCSPYDADGLALCRSSTKNGGFKIIKTFKNGTSFSYTDTGLKSNTTYYYKLKPYTLGKNGEKMYSNGTAFPLSTLS